jgi:hypothetical protein
MPDGFALPPASSLAGFVEFGDATFRSSAAEAERPRHEAGLLGSRVFRPMVFRRNDIAWVAACAWRAGAKADDVTALKRAKRELDRGLIAGAAEIVAGLVRQLQGERVAAAVTSVPCGESRRPDCLGKQITQAVAAALGLPFLQIFADRPCSGVSHPKEFAKLPPLHQIADPPALMLLVDDLATSGWHVEEFVDCAAPPGCGGIGILVDQRGRHMRVGIVGAGAVPIARRSRRQSPRWRRERWWSPAAQAGQTAGRSWQPGRAVLKSWCTRRTSAACARGGRPPTAVTRATSTSSMTRRRSSPLSRPIAPAGPRTRSGAR